MQNQLIKVLSAIVCVLLFFPALLVGVNTIQWWEDKYLWNNKNPLKEDENNNRG